MTAATTAEVVALRRDLHAHPELAFDEKRTTEVIVDWLTRMRDRSPRYCPAAPECSATSATAAGAR